MEIRHILNIVWKWAWLFVLAVFIASTTSYFASKAATPLYRTKTTLMIGGAIQNPDPTNYQIFTSQQLAFTYIQLASLENVLNGAVQALGLKMDWRTLANQVSASSPPNTQMLEITVVDSSPYRAKVLADEVARQLILQGPAASGDTSPEQSAFAQKQLDDLKSKIETGQQDLDKLNRELDSANSARQIQDLQTKVSILQTKISDWQNIYAQLLLSVKGGGANSLSVVESATIPSVPFSPNVGRNVLVAAAIGLALSALGVILIEYFEDTLKTSDDLTRITGLPALGAIAQIEGKDYSDKLVAVKDPFSPIVEAYRILRTNLQFSSIDQPLHTLILTSPGPAEGKSITLANLAVVLAQSGRKVIMVDADLRRPTQHRIFGRSNRLGLTDALLYAVPSTGLQEKSTQRTIALNQPVVAGSSPVMARDADSSNQSAPDHVEVLLRSLRSQAVSANSAKPESKVSEIIHPVSQFIQPTGVENLRLLSTGPLPPNPSELMGSERMTRLLELLKAEADLILVDSPPVLMVTDATILGSRIDGTILVIDSGKTRVSEARRAVDALHKGHINLVGGVMNRVARASGGYHYTYYHRYYGSSGKQSRKRTKKKNRLIDKILFFFSGETNHREK